MIQNSNTEKIMKTRKEKSAHEQNTLVGTVLSFVMMLTMHFVLGVQSVEMICAKGWL